MIRAKAILVLVAALAFAASPFYSSGFNGFDPQAYPRPQVDPPVQPAGYAFSIWGLIYAWLVAHGAFGLFARAEAPAWDAPRWPLFVSLAVGASWIPVANVSPVWATVLIFVMLLAALWALMRATPDADRWLLQPPVALYAGWLTAASFVSLGLLLAGYGIMDDNRAAWSALIPALAVAGWVQAKKPRAWGYGAAVAWAFVAVSVSNADDGSLITLGLVGAVLMGWLIWRGQQARGENVHL